MHWQLGCPVDGRSRVVSLQPPETLALGMLAHQPGGFQCKALSQVWRHQLKHPAGSFGPRHLHAFAWPGGEVTAVKVPFTHVTVTRLTCCIFPRSSDMPMVGFSLINWARVGTPGTAAARPDFFECLLFGLRLLLRLCRDRFLSRAWRSLSPRRSRSRSLSLSRDRLRWSLPLSRLSRDRLLWSLPLSRLSRDRLLWRA
jgi:hypothetical protein